jgi:hypothetical protein
VEPDKSDPITWLLALVRWNGDLALLEIQRCIRPACEEA